MTPSSGFHVLTIPLEEVGYVSGENRELNDTGSSLGHMGRMCLPALHG